MLRTVRHDVRFGVVRHPLPIRAARGSPGHPILTSQYCPYTATPAVAGTKEARVRARIVVVAAVLTLTVVATTGTAGPARAGAGKIRFTLNQIGPQNGGGEPSVAISPDKTIYVSAPGDAMEFWRSTDAGRTWAQGSSPESPSGDTTVNVDGSGAVY